MKEKPRTERERDKRTATTIFIITASALYSYESQLELSV